MRTNVVLDDVLMAEAAKYAGPTTKKELIHRALREFVANHSRLDLRRLRGTIAFRADYDHKAMRRGTRG